MAWSPVVLYHSHELASLTATSEATGYPVSNILQRIDGTLWKATSTATQYITFDAGSGQTYSPDYLLLYGHNLNTAAATVTLQYSTDNFSGDVHDIFTGEVPSTDGVYLKTFVTQAKRYWRLKMSGATVAPFITLGWWGAAVELDFADAITPFSWNRKANVNVGDAGYLQGIHEFYTERTLEIRFIDANSSLRTKVLNWEDEVGLGLFGIAWEPGEHSSEVWVMRRSGTDFSAVPKLGGANTDLTLDLIGRKE